MCRAVGSESVIGERRCLATSLPCPAAAEDEKRAARKFRLPAAFKRPGSRGAGGEADLASPTSTASGGAGGAGSGGMFDPTAALAEFYGAGGASGPPSPDPGAAPGSSATSPDGSRAGAVTAGAGAVGSARGGGGTAAAAPSPMLSEGELVDYPYLVDGDPTPAAYLLLACADYLRLYPTGGWVGRLGGGWCAARANRSREWAHGGGSRLEARIWRAAQPSVLLLYHTISSVAYPFQPTRPQTTSGWATAAPRARRRLRRRWWPPRPSCRCTGRAWPAWMPRTRCRWGGFWGFYSRAMR